MGPAHPLACRNLFTDSKVDTMPRPKLNGVVRSIVFDPAHLKTLEAIAKAHDVSVSWLVRKAILMMLTHKPTQDSLQEAGE